MKLIVLVSLVVSLSGCSHLSTVSGDRHVASQLQQYESGRFHFGIHKGKASISNYSVKSCNVYIPSLNPESDDRLRRELSSKGYRPLFKNELFEQSLTLYGFISILERKQFHSDDNVSGDLFLRVLQTGAKNEFDVSMREAVLGVFGEDGFELAHTYVPLSNKMEYLRISQFPNCTEQP